MSLLIRVELPTYSHSFQISVPSIGTVDDVKREIEKVCAGNPRVHGQRLIWRGRFLGDDEKVLDIWKVRQPTSSFFSSLMGICYCRILDGQSQNDSPVVHLSVHPSAWASAPPSVATISANAGPAVPVTVTSGALTPPPIHTGHGSGGYFHTSQPPRSVPQPGTFPRQVQPGQGSPPPAALPAPTSVPGLAPISVGYINYIAYQHLSAASVLRSGRMIEDPPPTGIAESKNMAKQLMAQWGYAWPSVFDDEYPPAEDESAGIKYEQVTIEWVSQFLQYLRFSSVLQWRGFSPAR